MAERTGNPVPNEIRGQLERRETPLVFELVTSPKRPLDAPTGSRADRFAEVIRTPDQHELLLTAQRIAVVSTDRRSKEPAIALSIPLDEILDVEAAGSGLERGRIRFAFADGSVAHGVMGLVLPRPARRFLDAYESTRPDRR